MTSIATAFLCAVALAQTPAETKTFVTTDRLLEMQIPTGWAVKKEKTRQLITFTTPSGPGRIEVYSIRYLQQAADWQTMQMTVVNQMKRTLVRQWEEEILAVPMLLTSSKFNEPKQGDQGALVGLLYTNTPEKFQFRLVAPLADFDAVEGRWREALLTLRTSSGKIPTAEDGQPDPAATPGEQRIGSTINMATQVAAPRPLGPVKIPFTVSSRTGVLRMPKGIKMSESEPTLMVPGLKGSVRYEIFSNDDSPASGLFVMQEVNKDLDRFATVSNRENLGPKRNMVGAQMFGTTRTGKSKDGDLQSFISVVDSGRFYVLFRYEATDAKTFAKDHMILTSMINSTGFEAEK